MPSMGSSNIKTGIRVLLYGPPKGGKTWQAAKLAEKKKLVVLDIERGWRTALQFPKAVQENILLVQLQDTPQQPQAIGSIQQLVKGGLFKVCHEHGTFRCPKCASDSINDIITLDMLRAPDTILVIDSLTQLTSSAVNYVLSTKKEGVGMLIQDWGTVVQMIDYILGMLQGLGINILCISHMQDVSKENDPTMLVPVAGTTKYSINVAKFFDAVVLAQYANLKYRVSVTMGSFGSAVLGCRIPNTVTADQHLHSLFD